MDTNFSSEEMLEILFESALLIVSDCLNKYVDYLSKNTREVFFRVQRFQSNCFVFATQLTLLMLQSVPGKGAISIALLCKNMENRGKKY